MDNKPKLSVTGYRAIWGKDLDEKIAFEYARSFARFIKNKNGKKVIVGRDARVTGPIIFKSVREAFEKEGIDVKYAGLLPTPTMLMLTKKNGYDAGVMITASHNPPEYNGMKFIMPEGRLTNHEETNEIEKTRQSLNESEKIPTPGDASFNIDNFDNKEWRRIHIDEVLKNVDVELIKSKKFKVALDPINSGGSIIGQELLRELGCEVHVINGEPNGQFAHMPEPLEINLSGTASFVKEVAPDVGFVQDPDADRLVLINEKGEFILEELMISLVIKSVLSRNKESSKGKNVVVNLSTTRVCEDIAKEYGATLFRTPVGEAHVVKKMIETNAPIGGEGSGGAIYPLVGFFRDSLSGMALILELLARENKKISEIVSALPKYVMKKDKFTITEDINNIYQDLKAKWTDAKINTEDGARFDWEDSSWVHIRPSNTEPIVRVFGEAKDENRINTIFKEVRLTLASK